VFFVEVWRFRRDIQYQKRYINNNAKRREMAVGLGSPVSLSVVWSKRDRITHTYADCHCHVGVTLKFDLTILACWLYSSERSTTSWECHLVG